jgi:hypothetical protein
MFEKELLVTEVLADKQPRHNTVIIRETVQQMLRVLRALEQLGKELEAAFVKRLEKELEDESIKLLEKIITDIATTMQSYNAQNCDKPCSIGGNKEIFLFNAVINLGEAIVAYATAQSIEKITVTSTENARQIRELDCSITTQNNPARRRYLIQKYYFLMYPGEREHSYQSRIEYFEDNIAQYKDADRELQ